MVIGSIIANSSVCVCVCVSVAVCWWCCWPGPRTVHTTSRRSERDTVSLLCQQYLYATTTQGNTHLCCQGNRQTTHRDCIVLFTFSYCNIGTLTLCIEAVA